MESHRPGVAGHGRALPLRSGGVGGLLHRLEPLAECRSAGQETRPDRQVARQRVPMKCPYLTIADQALESMRKFLVEFGLTPSSRSRIRLPSDDDDTAEFDRFTETG